MSVVIETTMGVVTVDLYTKERPNACRNFLKLCKIKYYNFCLFHKVGRNFIAQTGDPTATGRGGESINAVLYGDQAKYFDKEYEPKIKHEKMGTLSMVNNGGDMHGSQFFLTLGENLKELDEGEHTPTVFGEVAEGFDVLSKFNDILIDDQNGRPFQDIRITHTVILHDPYEDPKGLSVPDASPEPTKEMLETNYIAPDEELDDTKGKNIEEIEEKIKDSEAKARATILEMVGDIPDAEVKPPENVLFVCKLNPVTTSEDLELIFSRFGSIVSCEVIKDKKSGESLQYAFIEFEKEEDCENAFFKMDNVLIDDRRIHVDFSQSVAKLNWNQNKVGQGKPGRFQNFILKSEAKKSDDYEMIFDSDDDTNHQNNRVKNKGTEKTHHKKSYSSKVPHKDKYSSRSRDIQISERKRTSKHKSRRSRSPSESNYHAKEHHSRSSYKSSSRHVSSNDNMHEYRSRRSRSPISKKKKVASFSSDEEDYSKSYSSSHSKNYQFSKSHKKSSSRKNKHKTSDSSSSSGEYVSKSSKSHSESQKKSYKERKRSISPGYHKSNRKLSPLRNKDIRHKHSKKNKYDSSSNDSDSYAGQSKLSKSNSSNYKHSQKSRHRKRSSS